MTDMRLELRRFTSLIHPQMLGAILSGESSAESEPTGVTADLGPVKALVKDLVERGAYRRPSERTGWDRQLVEPLHSALSHLTVRMASDMRFWQWLCVEVMSDFVWARWHGSVPEGPPEGAIPPSLAGRFLGRQTLNGVSRNALSRLWWCGQTLGSPQDGYRLAREALQNQDFFQTIFERELGLYPPAARACLHALRNATEDERRMAVKRLNHYLTTIAVEVLSEEDIVSLLTEN